jgi:hypothetical protein
LYLTRAWHAIELAYLNKGTDEPAVFAAMGDMQSTLLRDERTRIYGNYFRIRVTVRGVGLGSDAVEWYYLRINDDEPVTISFGLVSKEGEVG